MRMSDEVPPPLTVARPAEDPAPRSATPGPGGWTWLVVAVGWTVGVVVLGWALVGVPVALAWLTAPRLSSADVVSTMGQGWLAVHGVRAVLGGVPVGLTPLGLTLLVVLAQAMVAHHAARQVADASGQSPWRALAGVVGACVATYLAFGTVVASVVGDPARTGEALRGLLLVSLAGAVPGAWLGLRIDLLSGAPVWLRRLPRAVGVGLGALTAGSVAAAVVALIAGWPRVSALHAAVAPDAAASALLVVLQVCWWPTLVLWAGSFVLGAGVQVGAGTVVAPGQATLGPLPGLPVLGALPVAGHPADWGWLLVGVIAGALAGWWMVRGRDAPGPSPVLDAAWQAALAGAGVAGVWVLLSLLATGDLGAHRLAGVGPRFPELVLGAAGLLIPAAAAAGAGWVWWSERRNTPAPEVSESIG